MKEIFTFYDKSKVKIFCAHEHLTQKQLVGKNTRNLLKIIFWKTKNLANVRLEPTTFALLARRSNQLS